MRDSRFLIACLFLAIVVSIIVGLYYNNIINRDIIKACVLCIYTGSIGFHMVSN